MRAAIDREGDRLTLIGVLHREVGARGVLSGWPATTTFYADGIGAE